MTTEIKHRFTGAVLHTSEKPLREAVVEAVETGADLRGAYLGSAYLRGADLGGADLRGATVGEVFDALPAIPNLDAAILAAIEESQANGYDGLDMDTWHRCESTHCRAGWAIHLSGKAGYELEERVGPSVAGALIYLRNGESLIPDWVATDEDAMADMRARAGVS